MPVTLRVKDVMDKKVVEIDENATVADAVKAMLDNEVWSLVVTRQKLPIGVVTERDVIRRCIGKGRPMTIKVGEIMSTPIETISPDASLGEAMAKLVEKNIRRLFVIENGKIIGRVTQTELFENTLNVMMALSALKSQL
ncbi:MAG: CBS domain-containing protein [Candidatus Caldarchaeum sp.]|jgi:signal-transduction protein with cAMP-binding, CBS, and nucleotidyltransferase domain|uniref:CBS domain-containing protein n=1 Tax=Caldiarchaeum subterraneum TaxID=311458 RepID=A0A7C4E0W2_CALS0|nr:CBS domain-containing protein [Candidatus Caldarchaeales archaeon]MDJ0272508.1 CBS domain-containing protein [Candidatus Caldarchaeales archaeon]